MKGAGLDIRVDRASPVPLYYQVSQQIEDAIGDGALRPGFRFENEIALADQLGLSRPTMRRAIQELVDKGLLVRKRGVGTQVVHGQVRRELALTSLYDDLDRTGRAPRTQVLLNVVEPAPAAVAEELGLPLDAPVRRLERLRLAGDEPLALLRNWLPDDVLAPTDDQLQQHGLYQLIRSSGTHLQVARQRIGARSATTAEARLLGERRNAALLTMRRTAYADSGKPIELGDHVYRPDSYAFEVTLVER